MIVVLHRDSGRTAQGTPSLHYKDRPDEAVWGMITICCENSHTHTYERAAETDCQVSGSRHRMHEIFTLLGCYTALICRYGRFFLDCLTPEDETETSVTTDRRCPTSQNSERSHIAKFRSVRAGGTYAYHCGLTFWSRNFTFKF